MTVISHGINPGAHVSTYRWYLLSLSRAPSTGRSQPSVTRPFSAGERRGVHHFHRLAPRRSPCSDRPPGSPQVLRPVPPGTDPPLQAQGRADDSHLDSRDVGPGHAKGTGSDQSQQGCCRCPGLPPLHWPGPGNGAGSGPGTSWGPTVTAARRKGSIRGERRRCNYA